MSEMHSNTLRMLPESFKIGAHAAVTTIFFEDNLSRVWRVSIDTRFQKSPKVHIAFVRNPPENWREMSADDINLQQAAATLDWLISLEKNDE